MSARPGRIIDDERGGVRRGRAPIDDDLSSPDFVALTQRLRELIVDARGSAAKEAAP